MKGLILIFVLLSGISSAIAQEKLWLDKNYQWTDDSIQAVRYALVSKINKKCIKVEEYALEGQKKDVWHFSEYKSNPRKRIREGLHTSFYANGKDSLTEVYRDNRLEGQTMVYYPDGAIHLARSYSDGKLDGTLLQYYPDGKLRRKEHYSENQCTDGKMFDKHGTEMAHQPYFVFPSFPGGIENLMKLVANVTKYPEDAWKQKAEGSPYTSEYLNNQEIMANFYTEVPELKYHLNNSMMERICELKERGYQDKDKYDYAPQDYADAMDSFDKVLEITGEITGEIIAPNAEGVDEEGPHCANGRVEYASGTKQNLDAMVKAGLNGMTMPRRFGGLNFPITPYTMCAEIVAAADAGFGNIWSLQDCIETLYEFGNEDQHSRFIPRVCAGETMSMDLTEPDAGSDLQSVMLKATYDEANNCWRLNGVKRFITNGDANLHLVLARSEEGTKDGRGLSMFIYDKNEGGVDVRRIENKLGIHGSPTCELVYKNAKAELCGDRKLGLIKYVMALMNGARLGIAAQSVGLSQAAYNEGLAYAKDRKQFGKAIIEFPAVYDMLAIMKAKLDAGRSLLYQTSRYVDIYKALDDIARERKLTPEERQEQKKYAKLADAFTPLAKGMNSEYANQNAYDSIQIHGGSGFMLEYACQRIYRDARITSIYEGTTQLQTVAAIRYVTNGSYSATLRDYEQVPCSEEMQPLMDRIKEMTNKFEACTNAVKEAQNQELLDFVARRLYEMAAVCIMSHLIIQDATKAPELFGKSALVYVNYAEAEVEKHFNFIRKFKAEELESYRK